MKFLTGLPLLCNDEESGRCEDLLFEDAKWTPRYIVASAGSFLFKSWSLVSPEAINRPQLNANLDSVPLMLSKEDLESAPEVGSDLPVSRKAEVAVIRYNSQVMPWAPGEFETAMGAVGTMPLSGENVPGLPDESGENLRSLTEVLGYRAVTKKGGELGEVHDFILDLSDLSIAYLAVDISPSQPGGSA